MSCRPLKINRRFGGSPPSSGSKNNHARTSIKYVSLKRRLTFNGLQGVISHNIYLYVYILLSKYFGNIILNSMLYFKVF
jgi:hypothetical protein